MAYRMYPPLFSVRIYAEDDLFRVFSVLRI